MRWNKKAPVKSDKTQTVRSQKRGVVGYSKKTALLEEAITQMNTGKYGRSSAALKELLALDPNNMEARRLFATLHLRLGSLLPARQAFDSLIAEAFQRQDYWLAESLLREYLTTAPRCVPFLEKLGQIYEEKGDTLEAVAEYGKAVDILIEDPDSDNPQRVSQLYTKIRDLAPASPVAFRLASFFDAQTSELLAPRVNEETELTSPPSSDLIAASSDRQDNVEPISGPMPWDLPNPHEALSSTSLPPAVFSAEPSDAPWQENRLSQEETWPAVSPDLLQTGDKSSEVRDESAVEIHRQEVAVPLAEAATSSHSVEAASKGLRSESLESGSVGEVSITRAEPDLLASPGEAGAAKYQEAVQAEAQAEASIDSPDRPTESVVVDTSNVQVSTGDPVESILDTHVPAPSKTEEDSELTLSGSEPVNADTTELRSLRPSPWQSVEDDPQEITPTDLSNSSDPSTAGPLIQEAAEDRSSSRSLWDSLFGSASQARERDSEEVVPAEPGPVQSEELVPETPASVVSQDPSLESQTEDHDEREERFAPEDTTSTGMRISRMPWDQVQESEISILPAQVDAPDEDITSLTGEQSDDVSSSEGLSVAKEGEGQAPSPDSIADEAESFSFGQDSEVSLSADPPFLSDHDRMASEMGSIQSPTPVQPETISQEEDSLWIVRESETSQSTDSSVLPDIDRTADEVNANQISIPDAVESVSQEKDSFAIVGDSQAPEPQDQPLAHELECADVDREPASSSIEESLVLKEPEQQGALASSPMMNERPVLEAQNTTVSEQQQAEEPIPDKPRENNGDVQFQISDCSLAIKGEPTSIERESIDQRETVESAWQSSPHTDEAIQKAIGEISSFSSSSSPPSSVSTQEIQAPEPGIQDLPSVSEEAVESRSWEKEPETDAVGQASASIAEPESHQKDWSKAEETIRFMDEPRAVPIVQASSPMSKTQEMSQPRPTAADAVGAVFESSHEPRKEEARKRAPDIPSGRKVGSIFGSILTALTGFLRTCFSTTRAIVATVIGLMVLSAVGTVSVIGGIGLIWTIMEEQPSQVFQSLTTIPQRTLSDSKKNGYLVLLGMDAAAGQDPAQAGNEGNYDTDSRNAAFTCWGGTGSNTDEQSSTSADVMKKWFRGSDPIGQFKSQQSTIKGWGNEHQLRLDRYGQWKKLPFEDWGYGQPTNPPCATVAFAHQLHVADGFVQSVDQGVDRLETDMEVWRIVLSQARTLPMKMLALQAINDNIAVASGLLVRSDFDATHLGRVTKLLRPLDQGELSIRWPMQSELVTASKTYDDQLQAAKAQADEAATTVASMLPMPKQRRLNEYAKYYEASYKAAGEGQYGSLPKWKDYIQFPATTFMDYLTNPIENIVGLDPLPRWDEYQGRVVDTDAHLRLASLQAWLRRGPADGDLLARLAKAGQGFYDPYTGLPMLVNMKKGVLYSVGHDGKDQDGDPGLDVVVTIPVGHAGTASTKSVAGSSKAK